MSSSIYKDEFLIFKATFVDSFLLFLLQSFTDFLNISIKFIIVAYSIVFFLISAVERHFYHMSLINNN